MSQPIVAIYISTADDETPPQFNDDYYASAYKYLCEKLIKGGADAVCVYDAERNYSKNGVFRQGWRAVLDKNGIHFQKFSEPIKVDILFDKNNFPFDDLLMINSRLVYEITHDKYTSYLFAPDFHAKSYLLRNKNDLDTFKLAYNTQHVALKELDGNGGDEVFVGRIANYDDSLEYPLFAQEFVDTSGGFKNLAQGVHDVRVRLFNGEVLGGILREPTKSGELRTNLHLGGKLRVLSNDELPSELIEKTHALDQRFSSSEPRFFSADWGFDKNTKEWRLFELNNAPGLNDPATDGTEAAKYLDDIARKLIESAQR